MKPIKEQGNCKNIYTAPIIALFVLSFLTGCSGTTPGHQTGIDSTGVTAIQNNTAIFVTTPPAELQLDTFYKKYLKVLGIPIVGSEQVPDDAFYSVQEKVIEMTSLRPDILEKMVENKIRISIMGKTELTTDMPEYRDWNNPSQSEGINWNTRGRGFGASLELPVSSCAEENLLCYDKSIDWYFNEDIFIHEFAHSIHGLGIRFIDINIDKELQAALDNAITKELWENTYARTDLYEYFAEGVQDWFNVNATAFPTNGTHNQISTRQELKEYDPVLYAIIKRYFPENDLKISCHQKD